MVVSTNMETNIAIKNILEDKDDLSRLLRNACTTNDEQCTPVSLNRSFKKHFFISLECYATEYLNNTEDSVSEGFARKVKPCIHSIPIEKLFFYLTESEFGRMVKEFQNAYVASASVKIYSMGGSLYTPTTYLQLGIWRGIEKYSPVELGTKVTPDVLYGRPLSEIITPNDSNIIREEQLGAWSHIKTIDNRVTYDNNCIWYCDSPILDENNRFLPKRLLDHALIVANASKNTGLLYQTTYNPNYGQHNLQSTEMLEERTILKDVTNIANTETTFLYKNATLDNLLYTSPERSADHDTCDSMCIGLFDEKGNSDPLQGCQIDLYIQTEINFKSGTR